MYAPGVPWRLSGVPWAPGLRAWILRGRRSTSGSPRGLMYALASPGVFWRPLGSGLPCLDFAWQAQHFRLSKGSDVRSGVPCVFWRPLGSGLPCLDFAWQAQHFRFCKGSDVRSGVPWRLLASLGLRASVLGFCVAGAALSGSPRGLMYALASPGVFWRPLGSGPSVLGFCVAGAALQALQGV